MALREIRAALDSKKISAEELTKKYLERISVSELNSFITVCEESALQSAKEAQRLIGSGKQTALTGIPYAAKDNLCTKNIRTTCASKMLDDFVPNYNAHVIDLLNNHNAIMLGKTNMDEFAMGNSSETSYYGAVKNPLNSDFTSGGSSSGSAAATGADLCAFALGSDTGGSIRQPAALCGVTGLKPTYGTVSRYGLVAFASSLDQIGVIASCAEDTGYVLNCICGNDTKDATSVDNTSDDFLSLIGKSISGLKIGVPDEFIKNLDLQTEKAFSKAMDCLSDIGCEMVSCSMPSLEYAVSAYYLISSAEAAANLARFDSVRYGHRTQDADDFYTLISQSRSEGFGNEVKRRIMLGNYALSTGYYEEYYMKAQKARAKIIEDYNAVFEKCDIIATPLMPNVYTNSNRQISSMYNSDIFTVTANLAKLPAIATPCGYDENKIPIGISFTGKPFDEKTIIAVCDRFEKEAQKWQATNP